MTMKTSCSPMTAALGTALVLTLMDEEAALDAVRPALAEALARAEAARADERAKCGAIETEAATIEIWSSTSAYSKLKTRFWARSRSCSRASASALIGSLLVL